MIVFLNSKIRIISYNCRGWKCTSNFVFNLLNDCDICLIQEHWLFKEQLQSLNISDEYSSTVVSGMVSTEFIAGRPFVAVPYFIVSLSLNSLQLLTRLQKYFVQFHLPAPPCRSC